MKVIPADVIAAIQEGFTTNKMQSLGLNMSSGTRNFIYVIALGNMTSEWWMLDFLSMHAGCGVLQGVDSASAGYRQLLPAHGKEKYGEGEKSDKEHVR